MSREQAEQSVLAGINVAIEAAEAGADLIAAGEMGIGNTTASSAITAAFTGESPQETTGAGHRPQCRGNSAKGGGRAARAGR